jgi:uncharacterized protein (DUF983 family)
MLVRGVFRRCAHCGGKGAFFTGWIARQDRCKTCGFKWERNLEGFQLGAAAMNIMLTGGSLLFVMGIGVMLRIQTFQHGRLLLSCALLHSSLVSVVSPPATPCGWQWTCA